MTNIQMYEQIKMYMKMKAIYMSIAGLFLFTGSLAAQEDNQEVLDTKISKSYTVNDGNKLVKNTRWRGDKF